MLKMLIADDELIIRRGLKSALDWGELGIEVIAEAEDGEIAYEKSKKYLPDIILVDINMPFMNGLELIEKINEILPDTLILIITGHDEFDYAKKAVKLNVVDYILKPVDEDVLYEVIQRIIQLLKEKKQKKVVNEVVNQEVKKNFNNIREKFLLDLLMNRIDKNEIEAKLKYYGINYSSNIGLVVIKPLDNINVYDRNYEMNKELLYFSIKNIMVELLEEFKSGIVIQDGGNLVTLVNYENKTKWYELNAKIEKNIEFYLHRNIIIVQDIAKEGIEEIGITYKNMICRIKKEESYTPIVILAKKYIEQYYYKKGITLSEVASFVNVNPTYLSRLLKSELGNSFADYLTKVRINKSIEFMNNHSLKMYEIADQVGYNTQHYFSTAFKKIMKISPNNYKKGGDFN